MSLLETLAAAGALQPIDLHLARLLQRRGAGDSADLVALAGALVSRERGRGHSCIDPSDWAGRALPTDDAAFLPPLPDLTSWRRALDSSPLVSHGERSTPLILDAAGRLYLSRYWHAEQRLSRTLRARLESPPPELDAEALAPLFNRLFTAPTDRAPEDSAPADNTVDWQAVAAAAALASRLTLVSGGPGTGKTTTVARILVLLAAVDPTTRIALAAPTGKAAARLGEAISEQLATLPIDDELRERVPHSAATLHRLLGYDPRRDRFRHHARRPLVCDALVVDEASMVDLLMMDAALSALPRSARIILLGDKNQLASVETGSVFGDLCTAARSEAGTSSHFAELFRRLGGGTMPVSEHLAAGDLADTAVELRISYRFRDQPGIGELAGAIRRGDADRTQAALEDPRLDDIGHLEPPAEQEAAILPIVPALEDYLAAESPAAALERLTRFRILCARRRGDWGIERLNRVVERTLAQRDHPIGERWYPARPILITANDYQVRLFNGDLGICWPVEGRLWAFFPGPGDEPRRLPLAKLPPHDTAWAMTVHKSQGSEFDHVLLVLGDTDTLVLSRELLYTGITRARRRVMVVGSIDLVRAATRRGSRRASGLVDALRPAESRPEPEDET
ncbi:MAG: exodeoxyribonuclease V subunit alpha, partial [Acidobacteriota bacterium]